MKILVTGAKGFVGRNLCARLDTMRKNHIPLPGGEYVEEVMRFDIDSPQTDLEDFCRTADFIFNFAGANRPTNPDDFTRSNCDFISLLTDLLKKHGNQVPVMTSSSIQASLEGRYAGSPYGESKLAGERILQEYARSTGVEVFIYRSPNLFGKWCRPNYNSVVATFCHNIAHELPIRVDDASTKLELLYIDDLVDEMLELLCAKTRPAIPADGIMSPRHTHIATLGEIEKLLRRFNQQPSSLLMPDIPNNSFAKKLYSTYLTYLPKEKVAVSLTSHADHRGSFTELLRTESCGQFSVNISEPGITKGGHWHDTKWEFFIVVHGKARIRMRQIDSDETLEFNVSDQKMEAIHILPGYTHEITNISQTEKLVTVMWCNECYDSSHPDTFPEKV